MTADDLEDPQGLLREQEDAAFDIGPSGLTEGSADPLTLTPLKRRAAPCDVPT